MTRSQIAVTSTELHFQQAAQHLAKQLTLPHINISKQENYDFILVSYILLYYLIYNLIYIIKIRISLNHMRQ